MNGLAMDTQAVLRRFDQVCGLVTGRGAGITMMQLGRAHSLARALEEGDQERVEALAAALDIDVGALR